MHEYIIDDDIYSSLKEVVHLHNQLGIYNMRLTHDTSRLNLLSPTTTHHKSGNLFSSSSIIT